MHVLPLGALVALAFAPADAAADEGWVRGGFAFEGGAVAAGPIGALPVVGMQGLVGMRIAGRFGVTAIPTLSFFVADRVNGPRMTAAIVADVAVHERLRVGVGPEAGVIAAIGDESDFGGAFCGARVHLGVMPIQAATEGQGTRYALAIGLDLGIDAVNVARERRAWAFAFAPTATVGVVKF